MLASGLQNKMYTTDVPLTPGKTYKFRVEARNSVGYSVASAPFAIIASQGPDKPDAPTTSTGHVSIAGKCHSQDASIHCVIPESQTTYAKYDATAKSSK